MFTCCKCGREETRGRVIFDEKGKAEYCLHCIPKPFRDSQAAPAKNLFENFTLENVRDEQGQKVTVNSLRELRAAEKRHNFALACMSDNDISKPPQHENGAGDITKNYRKKFNRDPGAYGPKHVQPGQAGVVKGKAETLVNRPNPVNH